MLKYTTLTNILMLSTSPQQPTAPEIRHIVEGETGAYLKPHENIVWGLAKKLLASIQASLEAGEPLRYCGRTLHTPADLEKAGITWHTIMDLVCATQRARRDRLAPIAHQVTDASWWNPREETFTGTLLLNTVDGHSHRHSFITNSWEDTISTSLPPRCSGSGHWTCIGRNIRAKFSMWDPPGVADYENRLMQRACVLPRPGTKQDAFAQAVCFLEQCAIQADCLPEGLPIDRTEIARGLPQREPTTITAVKQALEPQPVRRISISLY